MVRCEEYRWYDNTTCDRSLRCVSVRCIAHPTPLRTTSEGPPRKVTVGNHSSLSRFHAWVYCLHPRKIVLPVDGSDGHLPEKEGRA